MLFAVISLSDAVLFGLLKLICSLVKRLSDKLSPYLSSLEFSFLELIDAVSTDSSGI